METLNDSIDNIRNLKKTFSKGKKDNNTHIKDFQTENMIHKIKNVKKKKKSKKYNFNNIEPLVDIHEKEPSDEIIEGFTEGYKEGRPKAKLYETGKGNYSDDMYEGGDNIYEGGGKTGSKKQSPGQRVKNAFSHGEKITYEIAKSIVKGLSSADLQTKNPYSEKDILVVKRYVDLCSSMFFASIAAFNWYLVTLYREPSVSGGFFKFPFKNVGPKDEDKDVTDDYLPEEEPFYPRMLPDFLRPTSEQVIYDKINKLDLFGNAEVIANIAAEASLESAATGGGNKPDYLIGGEGPGIDSSLDSMGSSLDSMGINPESMGVNPESMGVNPDKNKKKDEDQKKDDNVDDDDDDKPSNVYLMMLSIIHYFIKYAMAVPDIMWHIMRSFESWICNITIMSREKWYILFFVLATIIFHTMYAYIKQLIIDSVEMKFSFTSGTMLGLMAIVYGYHCWRGVNSIDWGKLMKKVKSMEFLFAWPLMFIVPGLLLISLIPGLLIAFLLSPGMAASFGCITILIMSFFPIIKFCRGNPVDFFRQYYKVDDHIREYHDMYPLRDDDPVFNKAIDEIITVFKTLYSIVDLFKVSWFADTGQDESYFRAFKWFFIFMFSTAISALVFVTKTIPASLFYVFAGVIGIAFIGILLKLSSALLTVLQSIMKTIHFGLRFFSIGVYKHLLPLSIIFIMVAALFDFDKSVENITLKSKLNLVSFIIIMSVVFFSFIGSILSKQVSPS